MAAEAPVGAKAHAQGEGGTKQGKTHEPGNAENKRVTQLQVTGLAATPGEKDQVH